MSNELFATAGADRTQLDLPQNRNLTMHHANVNHLLAQELHRERLRQGEGLRLQRTALRARRALARQLMR